MIWNMDGHGTCGHAGAKWIEDQLVWSLVDAPAHGDVSLDRLDRNSTGTRQELDRLE